MKYLSKKYKEVSDVSGDHLDTLTYADMMMRQNFTTEKLYKQLQYMSPHNDLYKIRIKQLHDLKENSSNLEVEIDNQVKSKLSTWKLLIRR